MPETKEIIDFINNFSAFGKGVKNAFTSGCCYWFAFILKTRFSPFAEIYFNKTENHFACKIGKNLYDITGNCNNTYEGIWENWHNFKTNNKIFAEKISKDCILKEL